MRRRNFAASMVVTVSLAELACTSSVSTSNPPPPQESASQGTQEVDPPEETPPPTGPEIEPKTEPKTEPTSSAEGGSTPPKPQAEPTRDIKLQPDGTCMEFVSVDCPEGVACNPPPPRKIACPENVLPKATDAKLVTRRNDRTCWEETRIDPDACPKGVACNPPPPHRVQCPDSVFPEASNPRNVNKRSDGTCWEFIDVKCQPDATCNPPPPQRVRCAPAGTDPNAAPTGRPKALKKAQ